jgi:hypothetical protein
MAQQQGSSKQEEEKVRDAGQDADVDILRVFEEQSHTAADEKCVHGVTVTLLSRYSTAPHREHYYLALKHICKYLHATHDWGIIYWRDEAIPSLPVISLPPPPPLDDSLGSFPTYALREFVGFIDPHNRRSVTGFVFCLAGWAIALQKQASGHRHNFFYKK